MFIGNKNNANLKRTRIEKGLWWRTKWKRWGMKERGKKGKKTYGKQQNNLCKTIDAYAPLQKGEGKSANLEHHIKTELNSWLQNNNWGWKEKSTYNILSEKSVHKI